MARTQGAHAAASSTAADGDVRDEVAMRLAIAIGRLNRRIRPIGDGLTHGQLSALASVVQEGPIRPGDLARLEAVAAPTTTRVLADLESRGLVSRTADPADGRSFFVSATDDGRDAVVRARSERATHVLELMDGLDDDAVESRGSSCSGCGRRSDDDRHPVESFPTCVVFMLGYPGMGKRTIGGHLGRSAVSIVLCSSCSAASYCRRCRPRRALDDRGGSHRRRTATSSRMCSTSGAEASTSRGPWPASAARSSSL